MFKRNRGLSLLGGILCLSFVFLFGGLTYAAAPNIRTPIADVVFNASTGKSFFVKTTIHNDGDAPLTINSVTRISGSTEFTYSGPATPFNIPAEESKVITIRFLPTSEGTKSAVFDVNSNDPDAPNVTFDASGKVCNSNVCVFEPSLGDILRPTRTFMIELDIAWDPFILPVSQYKLLYACKGKDFQVGGQYRYRLITTRHCNPYAGCPLEYPWDVPGVGPIEVLGDGKGDEDGICDIGEICTTVRTCAVKAEVSDAAGRILGVGTSKAFNIVPSVAYIPPYLDTVYQSVGPGGTAVFKLSGGKAPYKVSTNNPDTTINGHPSPQTLSGPAPLQFTVENSLAPGCVDTSVVVKVEDSAGSTVTATYFINCP